jgi:hypothetical protein
MFRLLRTFDGFFFLGHVHKYRTAEHVMTNHRTVGRAAIKLIYEYQWTNSKGTEKVVVLLTASGARLWIKIMSC